MNNEWWSQPESAKEWINQVKRHKNDLTYTEQPALVLEALKKRIRGRYAFKSILEVGCGTGHLIGAIKKAYPKKICVCFDINWDLMNLTFNKYDLDDAVQQDITQNLKYKKKFDLVFTYQVLQHIPPDKIEKALENLQKLAKKEVWMWEGIGKLDYKHGAQTSKTQGGSWVWHIDKMVDCYEVSIPKNDKVKFLRQRLYKIKI